MPQIHNIRTSGWPNPDLPQAYVGRRHADPHHFGNPFTHLPPSSSSARSLSGLIRCETRQIAVQRFHDWLIGLSDHDIEPDRRKWIIENIHTLAGKDLFCWCFPDTCHAWWLHAWANNPAELYHLIDINRKEATS